MVMSDQDLTGATLDGRAQMLQMQLKAALRDAEEAERAAELPTIEEARAQLAGRLAPLMAERRRALDAQLAEVRALAQKQVEQARAEAEQVVAEAERVAAEEAARVEAERVAAEEAARVEAERVAAEEAARAEAERVAAEADPAVVEVEPTLDIEHAIETDAAVIEVGPVVAAEAIVEAAPVVRVSDPSPPVLDAADDIWRNAPPVAPQREAALPVAVSPAPAQVVVDAEAFARVFATVLAEVLSQRGFTQAPQPVMHPDAYRPAPQRQSFWSQARHLDVLLLGVSALIVVVVLAAWIV